MSDGIIDLTAPGGPDESDDLDLDLEGILEAASVEQASAELAPQKFEQTRIPSAPPPGFEPQEKSIRDETAPAPEDQGDARPSEGDASKDSSTGEQEEGERKRRKYDPLKDFDPVLSSEAALKARQLTTLSELKRIKRARVRHEGKRVVTDDVKILKSLSIEPQLPPGEYINYYIEPVKIEYYIPRESRFVTEQRFLYIPLIDPEPRKQDEILRDHMLRNAFVDIIKLMNEYPMYITSLIENYSETMDMYESLSRFITEAENGEEETYKQAFYMTEVLAEHEPTLASLEYLGEFQAWNLNVLVRRMNTLGIEFAASDKTISYFIKKRNIYWEKHQLPADERFEILAALFYQQAFPNRGLKYEDEDFFGDIFDAKFEI